MLKGRFISIFTIISLGIVVYSNSFFCSFHFDDDAYIVHNFAIRNIHNLIDIWNFCPCRVITFLSLALNYHFNGLNVLGYHLFNLTVHIGTAILVWWLCLLTFSTPALKGDKISQHANSISLFAALIFVTHPVQIEAVTYIWQRAASMAAFFYLASLCCYVKSRLLQEGVIANEVKQSFKKITTSPSSALRSTSRNGMINFYYISSLVIAVVAMFTKENAITLPLMILLYEFCLFNPRKDFDWFKLYPFWLVLFIIPQTMVLTKTSRVQEIHSIVGAPGGISPLHYLLTQFRVMITYFRLLILPINLNLDYDYPVFKSIYEIPVLTSFLFIVGVLYFAKYMFSKYRLIAFSIFWFFLTIFPESSVLPQTDVIFEHRLYLPLVGYCMFLASGVYYLFYRHSERRPSYRAFAGCSEESKGVLRSFVSLRMTIVLLSIIIVYYSLLTYQRNKTWINEIVLWKDIVQKSPHKARAYIDLGWAYYNQGDFAQAMFDYNKAIEISGSEYIYPYDDRGLIYADQGNYTQAIAEYDKAIKINPYYAKVFYHQGLAFFKLNNYSQALLDYNKAIKLDAEYVDAYNDRGMLYIGQGERSQAIIDFTKSLYIDPNQTNIFRQRAQLVD